LWIGNLKGGKAPLFFVWLDPWEIDSKEPRYCMWFSKKIPLVLFLGFVFFLSVECLDS